MKQNIFLKIALRVILLFTLAIAATYIPEYIAKHHPAFFGDITTTRLDVFGQPTYHYVEWGPRHYWFEILGWVMFILGACNVALYIGKFIK